MSGAGKSSERKAELSALYHFHGMFADKKILETIAPKEGRQLEKIRSILDYYGQAHTDFYQDKIKSYQAILEKLEQIESSTA